MHLIIFLVEIVEFAFVRVNKTFELVSRWNLFFFIVSAESEEKMVVISSKYSISI